MAVYMSCGVGQPLPDSFLSPAGSNRLRYCADWVDRRVRLLTKGPDCPPTTVLSIQ